MIQQSKMIKNREDGVFFSARSSIWIIKKSTINNGWMANNQKKQCEQDGKKQQLRLVSNARQIKTNMY
jgi:hypothetical protein